MTTETRTETAAAEEGAYVSPYLLRPRRSYGEALRARAEQSHPSELDRSDRDDVEPRR